MEEPQLHRVWLVSTYIISSALELRWQLDIVLQAAPTVILLEESALSPDTSVAAEQGALGVRMESIVSALRPQ